MPARGRPRSRWREDLALLAACHDRLREAVARLADEDLDAPRRRRPRDGGAPRPRRGRARSLPRRADPAAQAPDAVARGPLARRPARRAACAGPRHRRPQVVQMVYSLRLRRGVNPNQGGRPCLSSSSSVSPPSSVWERSSCSAGGSRAPGCVTAARASSSAPRTARWSRSRWTRSTRPSRAGPGRPQLRLDACTRWPEKRGCGQECLGQIEGAPDACLLRNILADWYQGKTLRVLRPRVRRGLTGTTTSPRSSRWTARSSTGAASGPSRSWTCSRPTDPVCWDCAVAEGFRRAHPELVTDRGRRPGPPPSMA